MNDVEELFSEDKSIRKFRVKRDVFISTSLIFAKVGIQLLDKHPDNAELVCTHLEASAPSNYFIVNAYYSKPLHPSEPESPKPLPTG